MQQIPTIQKKEKKILEKDIEAALVRRIKKLGGKAEKFSSPNRCSVPDRIIFWPDGWTEFVECKRPGAKPTPAQAKDHEGRREMGFTVHIIDNFEMIDEIYPT